MTWGCSCLIKNQKEYNACLEWVDNMFEKKVSPHSQEGEELQVMLLLIKQYEDKHYTIPKPDAVEAVKSKMKEKGLQNKDFVGKIGNKGYVSAILNKKKPMTLAVAKIFHKHLGVPAEVLLG